MNLTVAAPLRVEAWFARRGLDGTIVVHIGMGPRHAARTGAMLTGSDTAVAVVGFAGALDSALRPGQVVVATEVRTSDASVAPIELPSAPPLAVALRRAGLDVVTGPVIATPRLTNGGARDTLVATGAIAVEMESPWLLEPLVRAGVDARRLAVVRVISDTPSHRLVSPATVTGGTRAARRLRVLGPVLEQWAAALGPRRVLAASPRSFCAGVERAITVVERALERYGRPVYVRRQIVHNTHVVRRLEAIGAVFVQELDEVPDHSTVVLAAHGVAPEVHADAERRQLFTIDATCPLVAKVHREAKRYGDEGYDIVLIGHTDHEEVIGTRGEAARITVVSEPEQVDALDLDPSKVAYLTQTTLALDETAAVIDRLRERYPAIVGPRADDICYATQNRQEAVRTIAPECDLMVVVGSANSSNTNRLVEVSRRAGCPAVLVEDASELGLDVLAGARTIGLTAGASVPDELVDGVVAALSGLGSVDVEERRVVEENVQFRLPAEVR
ncbi:MAG TPA: 4-hydroxy-3-methylbut-2-enyl diphosphate reductase [Acidimicrobiales bacterium]|nr:4-hydroxy-3-methylbut-2-enyl diphosphate reductase [Acidimicrobiales bacterium]